MIKKLTHKNLLIILASLSSLALVMAYISQYFFGLQPCHLCLWQRKPFFIIIVIAIVFLLIPQLSKYKKLAIQISVVLLIANTALAFYHAGVEKKIFKGLDSCSTESMNIQNLEELELNISKTSVVRCDQPQFIFLGISMAGWNALYCLSLAGSVFYGLTRIKK